MTLCGTTSCGNGKQNDIEAASSDDGSQDDAESRERSAGAVFAFPATDYVDQKEMELADYWKGSNEASLAAVMKKAAQGKKVTIAAIGGSITQGTVSAGTGDSEVEEKKVTRNISFHGGRKLFRIRN